MAVETLKIVLTADNKQALLAMRETVTSLDGVSVAGGKAGGATKKLGSDFTGMSRVLQDLPYGFNAIANNLTNILPAAGALGLGISALVAGLQFAQNGTGAWTRGLEGLFGTMTLADKVNQGYVKTLSEEKVALDTLFKSAQDSNNQMNVRLNAINQLREKYGEYLKGYSDEDILVGKATKAHELLLESLRKESIAKAAMALAAPIEQKRLELEIELINQRTKAIEDFKKAEGKSTAMGGVGGTGAYSTKAQEQQIVLNTFAQKRLALQKQIAEELKKINQLEEIAAKNATISTKEPPPPPGEKVGKIDGKFENYMNNMKALLPILDRFNASDAFQTLFLGKAKPIPLAPQLNTVTKDLQNLQLQSTANNTLNNVLAERNSIQLDYEAQLRESKAAALTNTLMNSVTGLFTAMQNGAGLGEALGNMFKQVAIDIAKAAVQAAIFQGILMAFGGGGGLSFGQGFLGGFKKLLGFSQGGTVSGPQSGYPVMLHGTEHIVRPDQMKQIIASASQMGGSGASKVIVEGRIQGQDIWLSQQRTNTFRGLTN
jgi:hypothetical protein